METLPSDSRQPPDGHEFPDYVEQDDVRENYQDLYGQHETSAKSTESVNWSQNRSSFDFSNVPIQNKSSLSKINSVSNSDLRDAFGEVTLGRSSREPTLHTRSQSLIDMSTISKQKNDRWSLLAEQRRKGYSKLKGLVIPEHVSENDTTPPVVNIPEIVSHTTSSFVLETKIHANETTQCHSNESEPVALPLTSPPWASNTSTFPKYSPAFKRKSLQVYSQAKQEFQPAITKQPVKVEKSATLKQKEDELRLDNLSDSPKSLESITSPTRSDCSFDYVTKGKYNKDPNRTFNYISKLHRDIGKSEDESDNDSAVSSSQSSYVSRCSPPSSPTRSCEMLDYESNIRNKSDTMQCRLLKAASVEAINRKNILASAKCRSGRDLKVGSPVIQRKYEDDDTPIKEESASKPVVNGDSEIAITKSEESKPSVLRKKSPERTNLVILKPVLRETKVVARIPSSRLNNNKSMSVTDLRKSFEKFGNAPPPLPQNMVVSTPSKEFKIKPTKTEEKKPVINGKAEKPAKITSPEPKQEETPEINRRKIVLSPEFVRGSIGITLAGGTDYETKEITVHKIRYGSVAYNDGQLKKGDRILSINGKSTANLTHAESVELLKEPVSRFVLIVEDGKEEALPSPQRKSFSPEVSEPKIVEAAKSVTNVITITKNGAGLGFSIEGGKDSPMGDLPLRIKKIFQGGLAEKHGQLHVGDELLAINDTNLANLSRIETWSLMKKLPDGEVSIKIHR